MRRSKATTCVPEDNSFFSEEKKKSGIPTRDVLRTRLTLYQLSHRGNSVGQAESLNVIQGQSRLFPDKQGNSIQYCRAGQGNLHVHVHYVHTVIL